MLLMMSAQQCRVTMTLCSIVLHVCCIMNGPWLVEGEYSCYAGSLDIVNGELSVASTKYVTLQQCSSLTPQPPPTTNSTATPSTMKQVTSPPLNTTTNGNAPSVPGGQTTSSGNQTSNNVTTTSPSKGSNLTSSVPPSVTEPSPTQPATGASPGSANPNQTTASANPGGSPVATDGVTNESTTVHPAATLPVTTNSNGNDSLMGCVVVTKTNGSIETASFLCPTPDSACKDIGFNGSAGSDNQTHCFVGSSSNTIDAFINRENVGYSTVDSCFVGTADAVNETQCGESSNVCLTIKDALQGDNVTAYYCGNETLQKYCEKDGALREGSFLQKDTNLTVLCCASTNCNTPTPSTTTPAPSTITPISSQVYTSSSTAAPTSTTLNPSVATGSSSSVATSPNTASSTPTSSIPASSSGTSGSTGSPSTGALRTTGDTSQPAKHSNKILIIGIVSAFAVGLIGGIIVTVIICRRRSSAAARPGELLAFDSFHYKRMGADEVSNEEVFMT
ncbi:mucin-2-like isoform X1 [Lytechinus variegatus]|uniref:mucin-2-like isoform X1 n=1 Tax=Lytechinus variegatus TaxID=7654 RepID=UPI001BB1CFAF|nr:mucin-2-like isoform X1 [Lytechinus variegatus]